MIISTLCSKCAYDYNRKQMIVNDKQRESPKNYNIHFRTMLNKTDYMISDYTVVL